MKKLILTVSCIMYLVSFGVFALPGFGSKDPIRNTESEKALNVSWIDEKDPIRYGMHDMVNQDHSVDNPSSIGGVISTNKIETHSGALDATMALIQTIINYALGLLAFIALAYLIYHGFLMLTAAGDDKKFDKGKSGIKVATIALIGIGLSRLIISLILWFIPAVLIQ